MNVKFSYKVQKDQYFYLVYWFIDENIYVGSGRLKEIQFLFQALREI